MAMKKKPGRSKVEVGIPSTEAVFSAGNNNASGSLIANLATQNRAELAYELREIALQDIELNPDNAIFRQLDTDEDVETLANDIDRNGLMHNLVVYPRTDGKQTKYVLLSGERTALNYLQRMSGIATATRAIVDMLAGSSTTLVDTRKTTPGMRIFEKAAVLAGGATNHRFNLSDSVMLKDNHIAAAGGITQAVRAARDVASFTSMIEVECETLDQVQEALNAGADIIMLDNMDIPTMQNAVALIGEFALTECSGNVTAERIEALRDLGVNFISCGALTHSAGILDVSMKHLREE